MVLGLGEWLGREKWPLDWIQSVKELKVLGFIVCPTYQDTLRRTWKNVFQGFQRTLFAWESRSLVTLQQRVTVIQKFALSKLWYVAQALPLPNAMVTKIESRMSAFIFRGRHERLKLAEIENDVKSGGLVLTCIATKSQCLLLQQALRILERPNESCSRHLGFWLGHFLKDSFPNLEQLGPTTSSLAARFPLHACMLEVLEEGLVRQEYEPGRLESANTKLIYNSRAQDVFLPPKVEKKFPNTDFKMEVYPRLSYRILEPETRDCLFTLVHGLVLNKERMFQQGRAQDPLCPVPQCQNQVQNLEHLFCTCSLVADAWAWLRSKLLSILVATPTISNQEFILLQFPADTMDKECTWVLGNYCSIVSSSVTGRKRRLGASVLAGRLRRRLQRLRGRALVQPQIFDI